jgi:hypothetical protein
MENIDLNLLDDIIALIKQKANTQSLKKFEFFFILTLEIVRYELLTFNKISTESAAAITQLFGFQAHELFYPDFPELRTKCSSLNSWFDSYSKQLKESTSSALGVKDKYWKKYFKKSISTLIDRNPPNNF